jgi:metal-dependent amidase/aminoacylase/carboxypeptidase family protein
MAALAETLLGREKVYRLKEGGMGSEDFASYTYELPCAYLLLGAGVPQEDPRYGQPMHNPTVVFNEDVLPLGAALHAPSGAVKHKSEISCRAETIIIICV